MSAIINGDSPSVTFSDGTTQATSAIVSGKVPYTNLPAGSVLQVVSTTSTTQVTIASSSLTDITGLILSITPKFSTSKILVLANVDFSSSGNGDAVTYLVRNGTVIPNNALAVLNGASSGAMNYSMINNAMTYLDSPATTSAVTYKIQGAQFGTTTLYVNRRALDTNYTGASTITLMEIAG